MTGSTNFDMAAIQIAMVNASQRAQDKVAMYLQESTEVLSVQTITASGASGSTTLVTKYKFDLTNPTNSALFNAAVNNLQLINNYTTATLQSLKTMISTNISNMR